MKSYVQSEKYQVNYNKNIGLINFLTNQTSVINILKTELWMYFVFFLIIKVL